MVAGRAALVPGGSTPERAAIAAADAGARAVVVYGGRLPSGALDLGDHSDVPVVGVPEAAGLALAQRLRTGDDAHVSIAPGGTAPVGGGVAPFSSRGLAFDGRLKPDIVAPGVALVAPQPGETEDSTARFGTISGASAATAVTGAAVALLAQARPDLDAAELRGALVGSARQLAGQPRTAQGAGVLDVGAAAAAELAADPTTLAFHRTATGPWREAQAFRLRNISSRPVRLRLSGTVDGDPDGVALDVHPARLPPEAGRCRHGDCPGIGAGDAAPTCSPAPSSPRSAAAPCCASRGRPRPGRATLDCSPTCALRRAPSGRPTPGRPCSRSWPGA